MVSGIHDQGHGTAGAHEVDHVLRALGISIGAGTHNPRPVVEEVMACVSRSGDFASRQRMPAHQAARIAARRHIGDRHRRKSACLRHGVARRIRGNGDHDQPRIRTARRARLPRPALDRGRECPGVGVLELHGNSSTPEG